MRNVLILLALAAAPLQAQTFEPVRDARMDTLRAALAEPFYCVFVVPGDTLDLTAQFPIGAAYGGVRLKPRNGSGERSGKLYDYEEREGVFFFDNAAEPDGFGFALMPESPEVEYWLALYLNTQPFVLRIPGVCARRKEMLR